MTNEIQIFNYQDAEVRTVIVDGEAWFVANDLCSILSIDSTQVRRLDESEKGLHTIQTLGGNQQMTVINESGLYSLIFTSRKPEAKQFKKWVTSEVLPAIRKTGSYSIETPEMQMARGLLAAQKLIENQTRLIEDMRPKADFFDAVTESKDAVDVGSVAKVLNMGIGRTRLFERLRNISILMQNNQPYQKYVDAGYFRVIEQKYNKPDGSTHISLKTVVYQKGVDFIRRRLTESARQS